jgi:spore coat protein CotF
MNMNMTTNLSTKEKFLLEDQKTHEQNCIQKYSNYANMTSCTELKNIFRQNGQKEQEHLNTINQLLSGQVPSMGQQSSGQQSSQQQSSQMQSRQMAGSSSNSQSSGSQSSQSQMSSGSKSTQSLSSQMSSGSQYSGSAQMSGKQSSGSQSSQSQMSSGSQSSGSQSSGSQSSGSSQQSSGWSDKDLCNDILMTEKFVSGAYNTAIFEFRDPQIRNILNHIQKEEQQHGEVVFNYMEKNGLYQVK